MNRKFLVIAILTVVLVLVLVYFYAGSQVPSGQRPLEYLTSQNVSDIETAFNAAKDDARVLLLLSPT